MPPVIAYTLPTMQLVCNLVVSGTSGTNHSNPAVLESPIQHQPSTLPEGYVAYPDIGLAYKIYNSSVPPLEARNRCTKEGAQLAVIDSFEKLVYLGLQLPNTWLFSGIIRMDVGYDKAWVNVNTGLPVESITWGSGYPRGEGNCVIFGDNSGMQNSPCVVFHGEYYACELPIPGNSTIIVAN